MYTRVITTKIKAGAMDKAVHIYETAIVPALELQPGFAGATLLANVQTNTAVSLTFWKTEEQLLASESTGHLQHALTELAPFLTAIPENDHYAVRIQV